MPASDLNSITRAMTAEEHAALESQRESNRRFDRGCLLWALLAMPLLFATCGGCASLVIGEVKTGSGAVAMALVGLTLGILMLRSQRRRQRERIAELDAAVAEGQVEETGYRAKGAVVLHEPHMCAFVQLETNGEPRLLYLWGPYIFPMLAQGSFPTRDFKVVRTATAGEVITVIPQGEPQSSQPANYIERGDEVLEKMGDGTVFPGSLETLDQDLRAWVAKMNL